ncbi:MAG: hypothetical protein CVU11_16710 [Bacteroidetes bacterium HGW-Bacteroidetes-6]|jgi:membrane-bound ClpP family serine protease|nr:MAG: hypothetical protein CVU11_16710 [Bacteroidetes bacterium HGW-Bacteroidetes-6]
MSWTIILALIFIGIVLVMLEIFILPGMIAGIIGGIAIIVGIYQAYATFGSTAGHITASATLVLTILLLILLFRSNTWKKAALHDVLEGRVNTEGQTNLKIGESGITISRLSPIGKAEINGALYEVHSLSGSIAPNSDIEITKIEGYKIFVKPKNI